MDFLARGDGLGEGFGRLAADEELHVGADAVLLVDDAEAKPGVAGVEIGEHLTERGPAAFHLAAPARVGVERRGDEHAHQTDAALTE